MKKYIKSAVIRGLLFAIGMALFEYFDGSIFSIFKFLFHFVFFGAFMGVSDYFIDRRKRKKEKEKPYK